MEMNIYIRFWTLREECKSNEFFRNRVGEQQFSVESTKFWFSERAAALARFWHSEKFMGGTLTSPELRDKWLHAWCGFANQLALIPWFHIYKWVQREGMSTLNTYTFGKGKTLSIIQNNSPHQFPFLDNN